MKEYDYEMKLCEVQNKLDTAITALQECTKSKSEPGIPTIYALIAIQALEKISE